MLIKRIHRYWYNANYFVRLVLPAMFVGPRSVAILSTLPLIQWWLWNVIDHVETRKQCPEQLWDIQRTVIESSGEYHDRVFGRPHPRAMRRKVKVQA